MFAWIRDFVDDTGPRTAAGAGLVVGALVGALVALQASAGTPFSQADLDRVTATARAHEAPATDARGAAGSHGAAQVSRLSRRAQALGDRLTSAQRTIEDLQGRLDAATTAAPEPSATASATAPAGAPTAAGLTVTGTLASSWVLTSDAKPWPSDCSAVPDSYQVRISTGDHTTVAIGSLLESKLVKRVEKAGVLSLSCATTYRATVPAPVADVYEFAALDVGGAEKALDTSLVRASEIGGGRAPDLFVTYCPAC